MEKYGLKQSKKGVRRAGLAAAMLLAGSVVLAGCHGAKGSQEFTVPAEFDESRNYEITFWAKNDTNKTQTAIYEQAIRDFEEI